MANINGNISHDRWDTVIEKTFGLVDSLGGKWISSGGTQTVVVNKTPTVDRGADVEKILMWVGIGVAVLILAVVLIVIFKK